MSHVRGAPRLSIPPPPATRCQTRRFSCFFSLVFFCLWTKEVFSGDMLWTRCLVLLLCWATTGGEQQQAEERVGGPAEVRADARRQRSPPPVEPLDFGYVPAAVYDTHAYYEPGPIGILFHMVHAFLYVVQPNSFPKGESIILLSFLHIPLVPLRPSSAPDLFLIPRFFSILSSVSIEHDLLFGQTHHIK